LYEFLISACVPHSPPISPSLIRTPNNISWGVQIVKLVVMNF
jgi:hypothetical protein